jgi:hypothetical protein
MLWILKRGGGGAGEGGEGVLLSTEEGEEEEEEEGEGGEGAGFDREDDEAFDGGGTAAAATANRDLFTATAACRNGEAETAAAAAAWRARGRGAAAGPEALPATSDERAEEERRSIISTRREWGKREKSQRETFLSRRRGSASVRSPLFSLVLQKQSGTGPFPFSACALFFVSSRRGEPSSDRPTACCVARIFSALAHRA